MVLFPTIQVKQKCQRKIDLPLAFIATLKGRQPYPDFMSPHVFHLSDDRRKEIAERIIIAVISDFHDIPP